MGKPAGTVPYRLCRQCVMDTSDPDIVFDENGVCSHCTSFARDALAFPQTEEERAEALRKLVAEIKRQGHGKKYDCIIGLSGGVDSTYVAYQVKELGLRPLAIHFDNAWNSELAVHNIENIVKRLQIDLYTHVMDWEEFRDLQIAFLKASTPDGEAPTDHAILAVLLQAAEREKVNFILSGSNHATEGILPLSFAYGGADWRYIKSVHHRFGNQKLRTFPHFGFVHRLYYVFARRIRVIGLLNYLRYDKAQAIKLIQEKLGWRDYGGKHYESIYTRFYQSYILPRKFNVDKRRAHYSSLVLSGLMSRDEALERLKEDPYPPHLMKEDMEYVIKKLGLTPQEFEEILSSPTKKFYDYPSHYPFLQRTRWLIRALKSLHLMPKRVGI